MQWPLMSLVGAILGSLDCAAFEIPVKPNLDFRKLAGKWHPIIRAKYDPADQPFRAYTLSALNDGNIIIKIEVPRMGKCLLKFVALYALRPGVFENADGHMLMDIVDTDYDSYVITHIQKKDKTVMDLLGRDPEVSELVTKNFQDLVRKVMLNPSLLFYQRKTDICIVPP